MEWRIRLGVHVVPLSSVLWSRQQMSYYGGSASRTTSWATVEAGYHSDQAYSLERDYGAHPLTWILTVSTLGLSEALGYICCVIMLARWIVR